LEFFGGTRWRATSQDDASTLQIAKKGYLGYSIII
jgi:hypothetical protein